MSLFSRLLRVGEGRKIKTLEKVIGPVNALEPEYEKLSDDALARKTVEFRERLDKGEDLDDLIPEAFAAVREAARRVLGQRHFDVQLMGGAALHLGWIAEMKTGEGKTLVSTLPCYLNGLSGQGVHVVTVNDYLAKRDADWMGGIHRFLGLTVGLIQGEMPPGGVERHEAYASDITYGTNNEFGFDYLRDNMAMTKAEMAQRGHHFAIVDEVDSILIDEARTPLIISGRVDDAGDLYKRFAQIVRSLKRDRDYEVDEAKHTVAITEEGVDRVEKEIGLENLYDHVNTNLIHHMGAALKAKELYKRDVEYLVRNGEVLIVDEFTGRILDGRRYSEGLHQAIEAKENVKVKEENQTLATITLQNYFRMYERLAGMTGTAMTEANEFAHIYKLECVPIPTNQPVVRADQADLVYKTEDAKFNAVLDDIVERYERGQPILVGTASVEKSERLARYLDRRGIPHQVLNARHHEKEGGIIAQAGRLKSITVATNMAGRGVDIQLGGNPEYLARQELADEGVLLEENPGAFEERSKRKRQETQSEREKVLELGGLYVLGTERHDSRRIDNQLRGRSGRQGDPGESRFYLSLEDDLMRLFASDRINWVMEKMKVPDDVPIEAKMVTKAIERAQTQVEGRNFEIRKNILKYDDVLNEQRKIIYSRRQRALEGEDMHEEALEMIEKSVAEAVEQFCGEGYPEDWDLDELFTYMRQLFPTRLTEEGLGPRHDLKVDDVAEMFLEDALAVYEQREKELGPEVLREVERRVVLSIIDNRWREHLYEMDYLLEGINLRAMGQQDPLVAYTNDGFRMFHEMQKSVGEEFVRYVFHINVVREDNQRRVRTVQGGRSRIPPLAAPAARPDSGNGQAEEAEPEKVRAVSDKVPRNAPCPCGSGKKYKFCHGA